MKVLVALSSQEFFTPIFKFLNSDSEIIFCLENLAEDTIVQYKDKKFSVLTLKSLEKNFVAENFDRIFFFKDKDSGIDKIILQLGADAEKIFDLSFIAEQDFIKKLFLLKQVENRLEDFKILILGNESALFGLDLNQFNLPAVNLATRYQDLYFNFLYLKKILSNPQNKIKYVLFGISPYSFRFDLSQSQYKNFALNYYPIFKDNHNLKISQAEIEKIFNDNFLKIFDIDLPKAEVDFNDPFEERKNSNRGLLIKDALGLRIKTAQYYKDSDEKIFAENVKIFTDCIELCKKNSVAPIIITFPVYNLYKKFFSQEIFTEFKNTIYKFRKKYQIKFLDYFDLKNFSEHNFYNLEVLNLTGAEKFTPYISNYIDKLEGKKIKLAFLLQFTESWSKIIPLYEKMVESQKFDIYGIIYPNGTKVKIGEIPSLNYGEEKKYFHDLYDNDENMTLIDATSDGKFLIDLQKYHFDYVFYLRPYDYLFRTPFKCQTVSKFAKTFHILYGIMTTDNFISFYLEFPDFYNAVNFYFADCEEVANIFSAVFATDETDGEQQFIFRGTPEIEDEIKLNEKNFYINLDKPRKSVLWTPRWNYLTMIGGSHFLEYKNDFVDLRKKYPALKMITRPHPNTFAYMKEKKLMTEDEIVQYKNLLKKNKIFLDENPSYVKAIEESDIMITDVTSIMINFFLTGKPMIYCPSGFNFVGDCKDMERGLYIAKNWQEVEKYLAMLLSGEDPLKDERRKIFELLRERHKNACANIMQTLIDDYNAQAIKF